MQQHYLKISKVELSQIIADTTIQVNVKIKESFLPDITGNWVDLGEHVCYADGSIVNPIYFTNGVTPGKTFTVWATPPGSNSGKKKDFFYPIPTTIPATTIPATTLPATTLAPTTVAPTTLAPTTVAPTTLTPTTAAPTTLPPTTVAPTTTVPATTTVATPTIALGSAICRQNGCNDNALCGVKYGITVANAPEGSYLDLETIAPSSSATVALSGGTVPGTGQLLYSEPNGLEPAVNFILKLRDIGGTVIATSTTSLSHQSWWNTLSVCI